MLSNQAMNELYKAFRENPKGFLLVDGGRPEFAVLDYQQYQNLRAQKTSTVKDTKTPIVNKVLVTGGAGYIGSHTVRMMESQGYEVTVFDNLSTGLRENVLQAKFVEGDLRDRDELDQVFADGDFDAVIHFAATIEVEESMHNPAKYFDNNVLGSINLLNAMLSHGVENIIFSSTCAVYGNVEQLPVTESTPYNPESPYGLSKMIFEQILDWYSKVYGLHAVSLRYFNAAGAWPEENLGYSFENNSLLIPKVLEVACGKNKELKVFGQDYATPDGTCIRDYIHVLDLAEAHLSALVKIPELNGFQIYNTGTGQGNSVLEVIDESVEVTGKMVPMKVESRRPGDPAKLWADNSKIRAELGWTPKRGLSEIISDSWRWQKQNQK